MSPRLALTLITSLALSMTACDTKQATAPDNPLLGASPLNLSYPQFDLIQDSHFARAFDVKPMRRHSRTPSSPCNNPANCCTTRSAFSTTSTRPTPTMRASS